MPWLQSLRICDVCFTLPAWSGYTKIADCTVLRWIVLLTWLGFQILGTKLIIWERFQNSQWCCQAWLPQQRGWHKSTKPRLEAIPVQRKVQIDFVPWPCKASQMLQAHLKHVVFQAWNTWAPSRSVVETINCTLYGKSEYEDEPRRHFTYCRWDQVSLCPSGGNLCYRTRPAWMNNDEHRWADQKMPTSLVQLFKFAWSHALVLSSRNASSRVQCIVALTLLECQKWRSAAVWLHIYIITEIITMLCIYIYIYLIIYTQPYGYTKAKVRFRNRGFSHQPPRASWYCVAEATNPKTSKHHVQELSGISRAVLI